MNNLIEEIPKLRTLPRYSPQFKTWKKNAERYLGKIFGLNSIHVIQFNEIRYSLSVATNFTSSSEHDTAFKKGLSEAEQLLKAFTMELDSKEEIKPTEDIGEQQNKKDKSDVKLEKLQHQVEEKKMEAERRKAVVETKSLGAQIEIITILRQELKRRDEDTKKIPELQKQLDKIEGMLNKLTNGQPTEQTTSQYHEDVMYKELMNVTENSVYPNEMDARKEGKKCYFHIKSLRKEIFELESEIDRTMGAAHVQKLEGIKNAKKNELEVYLKKLSNYWSEFS